ncbi:MAG: hypothetical protein E4H21_11460 [Thermodesulfobacteriales bacterium]|jgi:transposase-like protein|nr:MAG: hypothetical protein E4H21_11460 [Thermodesulfobacteriales bacterium]
MGRKRYTPEQIIRLLRQSEVLSSEGRNLSEICREYGIHQNQYYIWRDKFLSEAHKAFDSKKDSSELELLRKKNKELTQIIGSLTVELKKTEDGFI